MISRAKRNLFIKTEKRLANCVIIRDSLHPFRSVYPVFRELYFYSISLSFLTNYLRFSLSGYNFKWEVIHKVWVLFYFFYFPRERSFLFSHSFQIYFTNYSLFCWNINIYMFAKFYSIMEKYLFREKKEKNKNQGKSNEIIKALIP